MFRARFAALADEARSQLDDAASAAPKVVEGAFRQAWEERASIKSMGELDTFLHDSIHHGAAREKSRRLSARHFGGHAAAPRSAAGGNGAAADVEEVWTHIHNALHPPAPDAHTAERAELLKHDTAAHMKEMAKRRSLVVPITLGVIAAAIGVAGVWYVDRLGDAGAITQALAAGDAHSQTAISAQFANISLDDGTKVQLAPESKLIVPKKFNEDFRAVKVEGAAMLTVAPATDKKKPFELRVGKAAVIVTGTVLVVRAYPEDSGATIVVREGSAMVKVGDAEPRALATGKGIFVDNGGAVREPSAEELGETLGWTDRMFVVHDRQLREVAPQFKRWYGWDIKVPELALLDRKVTMKVSFDSTKEAVAAVEKSAGVVFGYEGEHMIFRDTAKAPAGKKAPAKKK